MGDLQKRSCSLQFTHLTKEIEQDADQMGIEIRHHQGRRFGDFRGLHGCVIEGIPWKNTAKNAHKKQRVVREKVSRDWVYLEFLGCVGPEPRNLRVFK